MNSASNLSLRPADLKTDGKNPSIPLPGNQRKSGQISVFFAMLAFDGPARTAVFSFCCLIIGSVGVVDTYLVHEHSDSILDMEKNPVCLALIALDPHSLLLFTHVKLFCLGLVISTLVALFRFWNRGSLIVALGVAGFQLWLLGYLYLFSDFPHLWRVYID